MNIADAGSISVNQDVTIPLPHHVAAKLHCVSGYTIGQYSINTRHTEQEKKQQAQLYTHKTQLKTKKT